MTKREFLDRLKETLEGEVSPSEINNQLRYYEGYFIEQENSGKKEEEILQELGDPRLIARTIIEMTEVQEEAGEDSSYYDRQEEQQQTYGGTRIFGFDLSNRISRYLFIAVIVLFVVLLLGLVTKMIVFFLPFVLPVMLVVFVVNLIRNNSR